MDKEEINKSTNTQNASKITTLIFAGLPFLAILSLLIISGGKNIALNAIKITKNAAKTESKTAAPKACIRIRSPFSLKGR